MEGAVTNGVIRPPACSSARDSNYEINVHLIDFKHGRSMQCWFCSIYDGALRVMLCFLPSDACDLKTADISII